MQQVLELLVVEPAQATQRAQIHGVAVLVDRERAVAGDEEVQLEQPAVESLASLARHVHDARQKEEDAVFFEDIDADRRGAAPHIGVSVLVERVEVDADREAEALDVVVHHLRGVAVDRAALAVLVGRRFLAHGSSLWGRHASSPSNNRRKWISGRRQPSTLKRRGRASGLLGLVVALVAACGGEPAAPDAGAAHVAVAAPPDESAAYALAPDALRAAYHDTAARAARAEATQSGVTLSRQAAGLARVLARRQRDATFVDAARRHLREATRRARLPGACDAALELARLEAVDAADLTAAYLVAHRAVVRFGGDEAFARCVAEARRTVAVLGAFRPDPAVLAAADAAPDDEGELPPPAPRAAEVSAEVAVAEWAAAQPGATAFGRTPRLERVEILGAQTPAAAGADGPPAGEPATTARVALYFDRVAVFERGELAADGALPRRAYLDFRGAVQAAEVAAATRIGAGGVERVRVARLDPSTLRVAFDLEHGARYRLFFLPDPYRVVIDFDRDPLEARAAAGQIAQPPGGPHPLGMLVLDPGHGGDDHGARSETGLRESHIVLELAQRVKAILARRLPSTRVLLTRERDEFLSLERRAAMANVVGADAFVSIHLNASPTPAERGGVGTFVLDTAPDRASLSLAARENGTTEGEVTSLQRILASLQRADQAVDSRALAERLQGTTLAAGRREYPALHDRGTQSAMFYVLVGARMPAVLVEASFILRAPESPQLAREPYKQALAEGIADGIVRYARGQ